MMRGMQIGDYVIAPWWQTGLWIFDATIGRYERFYFRRKQRTALAYKNDQKQLFYNNQPWPVYVQEFRFGGEYYAFGGAPSMIGNDILGSIALRAHSPRYGEIWAEWALGSSLLQAPEERYYSGMNLTRGRMLLPQPLPLLPEDNFELRVYSSYYQGAAVTGFQTGLKGFDPYNKIPIARVTSTLDIAANSQNDFALISDRDKESRAMIMEELTFSAQADTSASFRLLELEINPPRGPRWTDDVSTPIGLLTDQMACPEIANWFGGLYHPAAPYRIDPGEQFIVEGQTLGAANQLTIGEASHSLFCCLYGYQIVPSEYYR